MLNSFVSLSLYFMQNKLSRCPWINTWILMQTKVTTTYLKNTGGAGGLLFSLSADGRVHVRCEPCLLASSSKRMRGPWGSGEGVLDLPPTLTVITGAWCVGVLWREVRRWIDPSSISNTTKTFTELCLLQRVRNPECVLINQKIHKFPSELAQISDLKITQVLAYQFWEKYFVAYTVFKHQNFWNNLLHLI
jgi:hypothetical protein